MCAVCVSPALEGWPIFVLCTAGVQRREGHLTQTLRSRRLPFRVLETVRGASPCGWRAQLHRRAWQQVRDEELPGAIFIDDGARLLPGFVEFLASGGYLHSDLTQFCHGRARVWLWGGRPGSAGVALRPLASSSGLASGYALSWRGAGRLLDASATSGAWGQSADHPDWPCDVARLGALVTRPNLVEAPDWLADAEPAPVDATLQGITRERAEATEWRDQVAAARPTATYPASTLPASTADRLRGLARNSLSRELSPGF